MTEAIITWTSMMGLRSKLTRTENDRNYEWLMQIDMKWFEMVWKYYHDEMWHFKEVETMTAAELRGIHTSRSKIYSYCVAITVVIILYFLKYFPPSKYFPCSKNHWYIKVQNLTKKENLVAQRTAKLFFGPRAKSWSKLCTNDKLKVVIV